MRTEDAAPNGAWEFFSTDFYRDVAPNGAKTHRRWNAADSASVRWAKLAAMSRSHVSKARRAEIFVGIGNK